MQDAPPDSLDALCLAAAPRREQRRDLEAELTRQRVLARVAGRAANVHSRLGRFDVLRCIGRGGMGKVFEARDRQLGVQVALKVLNDPADQALARLKREFRVLRDVSHPHLVSMYELHVEDELPFFSMELVDGLALGQLLARGDALEASFVRRVLLELSDALSAIHARGTAHGDIKPSNILVQRGGALILVDFGVARSLSDARRMGGTPAYMAPERLAGQPADATSDWYAVGAVLRELLAQVPTPVVEHEAEHLQRFRQLCAALCESEPTRRGGAREVAACLGSTGAARTACWPEQDTAFVGREGELAQLQQALDAASDALVVCTVSGEAGIGKTALVEHFLATVCAERLVLRGRCYEDEALPYKGVEGLIEGLATHLAELSPDLRAALVPHDVAALGQLFPALGRILSGDPRETPPQGAARSARQAAFRGLTELLAHVAHAQPLVLFLDDLQWGDADGAQLLQQLITAAQAPALLLIGSFRSDATGPCVQALAGAARAELRLGPLAPETCDALASVLLGRMPSSSLPDGLLLESGGSPLLLHALLRAGPAAPSVTRSYAQLMTHLLAQLSPPAHELLALVALAGCPVDLSLLGAAAGSAEPSRKWLPQLRSLRLVRTLAREDGLALLPHHDRIREVVSAALGPEERKRYHVQLAQAALRVGLDDAEFLAAHYFRAGELMAAAPHAERAGDRARAAMALDLARVLYTRALECHAPARPLALVEKLADVAAADGDLQRAAPLYHEAVAGQPEHDFQLRLRAAEIYLLSGAEAEGMALLRPAMRLAGIPAPSGMGHALLVGALALARCQLTRHRTTTLEAPDDLRTELSFRIGYMVMLHDAKGLALLLWSAARALRHGSPVQQGRALATLAHVYSLLRWRTPAQQDELVERALMLTEVAPLAHAGALACKALIAFGRSECGVALATLDQVSALIVQRRVDARWMLAQIDSLIASVAVLAGDFQRIRGFAERAERDAQAQGNRPAVAQIQSSRAWASLAAGDASHMQRYAAATRDAWRTPRLTPLYGIAVWGECHRLLYLGEAEAAHALMRLEAPRFVRAGLSRMQMWSVALRHLWGNVELACSQRPGDAHFQAAQRHAQQLAREPVLCGAACAALLEAGLARRAGHSAVALRSYLVARDGFAALGMRGFEAAATLRAHQLSDERSPAEAAAAWFASQHVADPASWTRMLAP